MKKPALVVDAEGLPMRSEDANARLELNVSSRTRSFSQRSCSTCLELLAKPM